MEVSVTIAEPADRPVIRSLLAPYLAELASFGDVDPTYPYFERYWSEPEARWPYLLHARGELAGFAFVNTHSPSGMGTDFAMAEFYVLPQARGSGVGARAAALLFDAHPGEWEVSVLAGNTRATHFWRHAIEASGYRYDMAETDKKVIFRFRR